MFQRLNSKWTTSLSVSQNFKLWEIIKIIRQFISILSESEVVRKPVESVDCGLWGLWKNSFSPNGIIRKRINDWQIKKVINWRINSNYVVKVFSFLISLFSHKVKLTIQTFNLMYSLSEFLLSYNLKCLAVIMVYLFLKQILKILFVLESS